MSKSKRISKGGGQGRNLSVRAVRRDPPDLHKLSRALLELALAQAEADAEAQARAALTAKPTPAESEELAEGDHE